MKMHRHHEIKSITRDGILARLTVNICDWESLYDELGCRPLLTSLKRIDGLKNEQCLLRDRVPSNDHRSEFIERGS